MGMGMALAISSIAAAAEPPSLVAPQGAISDATPEFQWQAAAGATMYQIAIYDETASSYAVIEAGLTGTTWTPSTPLDDTHSYRWKMRSFEAGWGSWGPVLRFNFASASPDPPTLLQPMGTISDTTPQFAWGPVAGALSYQIGIYDVTAGAYALLQAGLTGSSWTLPTALDDQHVYRWKMRSRGATWGSWGGSKVFDFEAVEPPDPPVLVAPSGEIGDTTPLFQWQSVADASMYQIAIYDLTAGAYLTLQAGLTGTSWSGSPTLDPSHSYRWKMRSFAQIWGSWGAATPFDIAAPAISNYSLHFRGTGSGDVDRVKIPVDDPADSSPGPPADVGAGDFTLELWLKADAANTAATVSCGANIDWINGNILVDRDRYNQDRKFGISLAGGRAVFGVSGDGTGDRTICGTNDLRDGEWHHLAVQRRRSDGWMWLYVDGSLAAQADGPDGDVSYPDDGVPCADCCGGQACDFSDPFLVIGAEKHDAGAQFPSFSGYVDEVRLSTALRYSGASFAVPTTVFEDDTDTAALYHFEEGNGDFIADSSSASGGPSHGERRLGNGGSGPIGPHWAADTPFASVPSLTLQPLVSGLDAPVAIANAGDDRLFIVLQSGRIVIWDGSEILDADFLDIESIVLLGPERGLLGLAFHPDYASNGSFYVNYINLGSDTVVARYQRSASDPNLAAQPGVPLLTIDQPGSNHNGGDIHFGPDSMLYIASGDGGGGGDASCYGQRDDTLLGKMLRIAVDPAGTYSVPGSNPLFDGVRDETWSKGLRNPWRFSFDSLTGAMFIADVGQRAYEEVHYQPADSTGGENYGWKVMEGNACYIDDCPNSAPNCNDNNCPSGMPACNDPQLDLPIVEYDHGDGCSITGGYVYRGASAPQLYGMYLYGDYCQGTIWAARQDEGAWQISPDLVDTGNITTFGVGADGELYVAAGGTIYRVE